MQGTTLHMVVAAVSPGETGRQSHREGNMWQLIEIEGGRAQLSVFFLVLILLLLPSFLVRNACPDVLDLN